MVGERDLYRLSKDLVYVLRDKGIFYLAQVASTGVSVTTG